MSQRAVEQAVGKLVTDEEFRAAFFENPLEASLAAGLELTLDELGALKTIGCEALGALCARLDDRICRIWIREPTRQMETRP